MQICWIPISNLACLDEIVKVIHVFFFFNIDSCPLIDLGIVSDLDKDLLSSLMLPEPEKTSTRADLADFLLFFQLIYVKSTSSRSFRYLSQLLCSLMGLLTLWKGMINLINGFQ